MALKYGSGCYVLLETGTVGMIKHRSKRALGTKYNIVLPKLTEPFERVLAADYEIKVCVKEPSELSNPAHQYLDDLLDAAEHLFNQSNPDSAYVLLKTGRIGVIYKVGNAWNTIDNRHTRIYSDDLLFSGQAPTPTFGASFSVKKGEIQYCSRVLEEFRSQAHEYLDRLVGALPHISVT